MTQASSGGRERPLSPHLQVWRWHVTMLTSILNRVTGVGLYGATLLAAAWAVTLAAGPQAYSLYMGLLGSIPGKAALFLVTVSLFYHLGNGVRHLVWDAGRGLDIKSANASSAAVIAFGLVAAVAVWIVAGLMGAL
ncbi:MAG: succinate dehydrogenase, cytochrome b556 subunit [Caulobacteraceae bacterium]|jgi:succinate dehydrogenase / fumarate reductase cytochrome b subunit|nr:succinate dehydrogenase, cytochrome b556 subunit [Caulobacteraceae bacterium]